MIDREAGYVSANGPGGLAQGSDVELIFGVVHAQRAALAEIYRRHGGQLHDSASRFCGKRADHGVEQVLLDLWRDPGRFDARRCSLQAFLVWQTHARAVRTAPSARPRRVRKPTFRGFGTRPRRHLEMWLEACACPHAWRRMSALPDEDRPVIALANFCGQSCDEFVGILEPPADICKRPARASLVRLARQSDGLEPWPC